MATLSLLPSHGNAIAASIIKVPTIHKKTSTIVPQKALSYLVSPAVATCPEQTLLLYEAGDDIVAVQWCPFTKILVFRDVLMGFCSNLLIDSVSCSIFSSSYLDNPSNSDPWSPQKFPL